MRAHSSHAGRQPLIERHKMSFVVAGTDCTGYLYRPAASASHPPVVVMAHGFSGTQQGSVARTAWDFAERGFAVFTFDYRGFGESGGEPRQVIEIAMQHEDWKQAIAFVRKLDGIDGERLALWGSSLSGGHVIEIAARDVRIAAVVAQVPFNGVPKRVEGRSSRDAFSILSAAVSDRVRGWLGLAPIYLPVVGPPGGGAVIITERWEAITELMKGTHWKNEVASRVILDMAFWYRPSKVAHKLNMPVLVCLAERDAHTPSELGRQIADRAPRGQIRSYACSHFDFYDEPIRTKLVEDQAAFMKRALAFGCEKVRIANG